MAGKIIPFDYHNKRDQFEAEMLQQDSPWNIMLSVNVNDQTVRLNQNAGKISMRFPHPDTMRAIAGILTDYAGKWDRGELPGLTPPAKEESAERDA